MQNRFMVEGCSGDKNSFMLLSPGFNLCAFKVAGPKIIFYAHKRKFLLATKFRMSVSPVYLPSSLYIFLSVGAEPQ